MTKKIIILLVCFLQMHQTSFAQRGHVAYLELGGAGIFYSFNYDVRFLDTADGFGLRIGLELFDSNDPSFITLGLPMHFNYLLGEGKHKFELGMGTTYLGNSNNKESTKYYNRFIPSGAMMYRFQGKHFLFRAGLSPYVEAGEKTNDFDWFAVTLLHPGLAFGYAF